MTVSSVAQEHADVARRGPAPRSDLFVFRLQRVGVPHLLQCPHPQQSVLLTATERGTSRRAG